MIKTLNKVRLEGALYDHKLEMKVTGPQSKNPGVEYIAGKVMVATDSDMLNIVEVNYTYVTPRTANDKPNATYDTLKGIMDGKHKTHMNSEDESPAYVQIDTSIGVNEFYSDRQGRLEEPELVQSMRNEGGFIHICRASELKPTEEERNNFTVDMVITRLTHQEANEERNWPEKDIIHGVVFNFRNEILPVRFSVTREDGMNFFESFDYSSPVFLRLFGTQIAQAVPYKVEVEVGFGKPQVIERENTYKDWVLESCGKEPYLFGEEDVLTVEEFQKMIADHNVKLAEAKTRFEDSKKNGGTKKATATVGKADGMKFNF